MNLHLSSYLKLFQVTPTQMLLQFWKNSVLARNFTAIYTITDTCNFKLLEN